MRKISVAFCLFGFAGGIFAQEKTEDKTANKLEEIVIEGNRLTIPFSESTRDIRVITQEEIQRLPAKSINELLAYVGGVDIRQRGPFGAQADVSIDGGTSEQTLVLLNGIKLINAQTAHNMMNIPVPLEAIDHIEVLSGAAARVYGINALTGAINIVTKKSKTSFVTANVELGSSFEAQAPGDGNGVYGGGSMQLVGNYGGENQRHLFALSQDLYNGQRYNTAYKATRLFYNGAYEFDTNNSIEALAGYVHNRFGANGFYAAPGDKNAEEIAQTAIFSISSEHHFGNFTISPRISDRYDKDDYRYYKHNLNAGRSIHYTNALMAELNASLETEIGDFGFGLESRFGKINSSNIGEHERNNHGAYAEYRNKFFGKLITNVGVYANYNTDYGWQAYPGIDLGYLVTDYWKVSASIGSGQRIPSFSDLYLDQAPGNVGNPNVQPESAWEYEANIEYHKGTFHATAGAFYRNITDFIDWVRPNKNLPYSPVNFGENKVYGIDVHLRQQFYWSNDQEFGYRLSYNYLDPQPMTRDDKQSKYVLQALKHQLIAGVNYSYQDFTVQVTNRYIKRMLNDPYAVLDLRASYQLDAFRLYTDVSNILNAEYKEAGAVPMPSRWFSIGVTFNWQKG